MISNPSRLAKVGPTSDAHGFPLWYKDGAGTLLELSMDATNPFTPQVGDPLPFSSVRPNAPADLPEEAFYWLAEVRVPSGGGAEPGEVRVILALEATFGGTGDAVDGQQIVFGRIRFRIDDGVPGAFYTFTHPFGQSDPIQADERGRVRATEDIGVTPLRFEEALDAHVAPFLTWTSGADRAPGEGDPPAGYVGDGTTEHTITGSPLDTNFVRVEGLNIADGGPRDPADPNNVNVLFTPLFVLQGRVAQTIGVDVARAVYNRDGAGNVTVDVFASSEPGKNITLGVDGQPDVVMQGEQGNYFARVATGAAVPAEVTVTNSSDVPPSTKVAAVTDAVVVSQADFDSAASTLTVTATSSDLAAGPVLTVTGPGLVAAPPGVFNLAAPPVTITVASSQGGSSSRTVTSTP